MDSSIFLHKLMRFCAYRERCLAEVREKLRTLYCPPELLEEVIVGLMDQDFLNEERYARSFVRGKFRMKGWGRVKIRSGLRVKQISESLIEFALLEELDAEEYVQEIENQADKKAALLGGTGSGDLREKVRNFLVSKGFEWEEVDKVLSKKGLLN